ncbi:MAG TPA: hypothetical protein VGQ83_38925 [Polyangia bacterium]
MARDPQSSSPAPRVLVASRDPAAAAALLELLAEAGMAAHRVEPAGLAPVAGAASERPATDLGAFDVVLIDSPDLGEAEWTLVARVRARSPMMEIVIIAADGAVDNAVLAVRTGVFAVLPSPVTREQLRTAVAGAHRRKRRGEQRIAALNGAGSRTR